MNPRIPHVRYWKWMLAALLCAAVAGVLGRVFFDAEALAELTGKLIIPVQNVFIKIISIVAPIVVFISVMCGISGMQSLRSFGSFGGGLMLRYILMLLLAAGLTALGCGLHYGVTAGAATEREAFSELLKLLWNIVPKNLWDPFIQGNTMQVLVLAVVFGIIFLLIARRVAWVRTTLNVINIIMRWALWGFSFLIPLYSFFSVTRLIWERKLGDYAGVGLLVLQFIATSLLFGLLAVAKAAIRLKRNPFKILLEILPIFAISVSTSASALSIEPQERLCKDDYGMDPALAEFGVPLGLMFYKASSAIYLVMCACYFANYHGVALSPLWLGLCCVVAIILTISIPPVQGGGLNVYLILFNQLGISLDSLGLAISMDPLVEFPITGFNVFCQPLEVLCAGKKAMKKEEQQ